MQTVYKYPISMQADVRVMMPEDATVIAVGIDGTGSPCVWALVDPDAPATVERKFGVYGTGGRIPDFWEFRGTFFTLPYVWHVFEEKRS
jgi:hypothetical protein